MTLPDHLTLSTALNWMWNKEGAIIARFHGDMPSASEPKEEHLITDGPLSDAQAIELLCAHAMPVPHGLDVRGGYLTFAGQRMKQPDTTTCGVMCALVGMIHTDPQRAVRLARVIEAEPERFSHMVTSLHSHLNRSALGLGSWPSSAGTPPWAIARAFQNITGATVSRPVNDRSASWPRMATLLAQAAACVPLVLAVGGDRASGLAAAVPRHYVMTIPDAWLQPAQPGKHAVPTRDPHLHPHKASTVGCAPDGDHDEQTEERRACVTLYDPSTGKIHRHNLLQQSAGPVPALGHWQRIHWVIYPHPMGK